MKVGVIDYGVGNLGSVYRALEELRVSPVLVNRATDLHTNDCLILPGVGNFSDCARLLGDGDWSEALRQEALGNNRPLLGICVGMQLLAEFGMEGTGPASPNGTPGLGLVQGTVQHLSKLGCTLRLPHVGWNQIKNAPTQDALFKGIPDGTDFYFVHSYAFVPTNPLDVIAFVEYGASVPVAVRSGHIWGTQFHPEKSSKAGFRLLRNFIETR
jgi:glutamine amidotransferase